LRFASCQSLNLFGCSALVLNPKAVCRVPAA
jgi:hypothetical protein